MHCELIAGFGSESSITISKVALAMPKQIIIKQTNKKIVKNVPLSSHKTYKGTKAKFELIS
jgi:hypothetical protein